MNQIILEKRLKYKWLYETFEQELFAYGIAFGLEKETVEDLIHDVFVHLWDHDSQLWKSENLKFYLFRCLKNQIISFKRKHIVWQELDRMDSDQFIIQVNGFEILKDEEERLALKTRIENLLACLTPRQKEAIYLRYSQDLSFEEIGLLLDITTKAAQKLVYRALAEMREKGYPVGTFLFLLQFS